MKIIMFQEVKKEKKSPLSWSLETKTKTIVFSTCKNSW